MIDLSFRSREEEQMDAPDLPSNEYAAVLRDLAMVNRWTFTARPALMFLRHALASEPRAFSLLDVGFGNGDVLRAVARWAQKRGLDAHLIGVDLNEKSLEAARVATSDELKIEYRFGDYAAQLEPFDFVISSQVAHHMNDDQLERFLQFMEGRARRGWLICDLHRHAFAYRGFPLLARLLRVHRIVREDGQLSIARSFRPQEWPSVLSKAGLPLAEIQVHRRFPFRLTVERLR